ncbi:MAG: tyrosine-type recombinase/integrase [Promethearchaeota archaeon]
MSYNYNVQKRLDNVRSLDILEVNKKYIIDFVKDQAAQNNSIARQVKYASIMSKIMQLINYDFKKASKNQIKDICSKINNSNLSDWTKHDYKLSIKVLYRFLNDLDNEEYPNEVKWIKLKKKNSKRKLPRDLLTIEDAKEIANNTNNPRDRCLCLMLYESGTRISELLELKNRDFNFEKGEGKYIHVTLPDNGKTGARTILLVASYPAILNWKKYHPRKNDKQAYFFCGLNSNNKGERLQYRHVNDLLKEAGEKAGIDKPLNPHHFRHSRATELAKKLTEAQLCNFMGWVIGSREAATYVHLSGRDTDSQILEMYGLKQNEEEEIERFKPINCLRCETINDPAAKFCSNCGLGLDEKSLLEYDKQKEEAIDLGMILKKAKDNDQIKEMLRPLLREILQVDDKK